MITQQQQDELDRTVKLSVTTSSADFDATLPVGITDIVNAGSSLIINSAADGFDIGPTVVSIAAHEADTTSIHGIADTSLLLNTTNTLGVANKTFDNTNVVTVKDTNLTIQDDADTTKQAKFQLSTITTGTTRTYTLPDASSTLVDLTSTQSMSGKTFDILGLDGQASTPSTPAAGFYKAYVDDSTGKMKHQIIYVFIIIISI